MPSTQKALLENVGLLREDIRSTQAQLNAHERNTSTAHGLETMSRVRKSSVDGIISWISLVGTLALGLWEGFRLKGVH